jgi:hypothetical protein
VLLNTRYGGYSTKPVSKVKNLAIELLFDNNEYDTSVCWRGYSPGVDIKSLITKFIPVGESWDEDLCVWENDDHSDIQIWFEGNKVDSIKVRFDLREDIEEIKKYIIALAKDADCCLFFPEGKVIETSDLNNLNRAISDSRAARFIENPKKFLDKLK